MLGLVAITPIATSSFGVWKRERRPNAVSIAKQVATNLSNCFTIFLFIYPLVFFCFSRNTKLHFSLLQCQLHVRNFAIFGCLVQNFNIVAYPSFTILSILHSHQFISGFNLFLSLFAFSYDFVYFFAEVGIESVNYSIS